METLGRDVRLRTPLLKVGVFINGAFHRASLIDVVSLHISPAIHGPSGLPTILEDSGEMDKRSAAGQALQHLHTKTLDGDKVWLRYRGEDADASWRRLDVEGHWCNAS